MDDRPRDDAGWLRYTFELAQRSRKDGEHPFAAALVVREAVRRVPLEDLPSCTLYSSTEPCMMCAGAIAWSTIGTVVFGLSQVRLNEIPIARPPRFAVPTRLAVLLSGVQPPIVIRGPLLEDESLAPHLGYWAPHAGSVEGRP